MRRLVVGRVLVGLLHDGTAVAMAAAAALVLQIPTMSTGVAPASWLAYCVVSFLLPAAEMPRQVGLLDFTVGAVALMRTGALVFCAQHCVDSADESAVWSL